MSQATRSDVQRVPIQQFWRWLRKEYLGGITQVELAAKMGIAQTYLSAIEAGDRPLSPARQQGLVKALARRSADARMVSERMGAAYLRARDPDGALTLELSHLAVPMSEQERWLQWGRAVRTAMKRRKIPVEVLAPAVGLDSRYLVRALEGNVQVPRHEVALIATHLGEDPDLALAQTGYLPSTLEALLPQLGDFLDQKRHQLGRREQSLLDVLLRTVVAHETDEETLRGKLPS